MSKPFHVWSSVEKGRVSLRICRLGYASHEERNAPIQLEHGVAVVELSLGSMMRLLTDIAGALCYRAVKNDSETDDN